MSWPKGQTHKHIIGPEISMFVYNLSGSASSALLMLVTNLSAAKKDSMSYQSPAGIALMLTAQCVTHTDLFCAGNPC